VFVQHGGHSALKLAHLGVNAVHDAISLSFTLSLTPPFRKGRGAGSTESYLGEQRLKLPIQQMLTMGYCLLSSGC
jgi:hypothetical protein